MDTHAAAMCGYCGASARIKFDIEQFAALFNELQARGDKTKLSNCLVSERPSIIGTRFVLPYIFSSRSDSLRLLISQKRLRLYAPHCDVMVPAGDKIPGF